MDAVHLEILPQPDDYTCGPTCLHAIYRYFDDELPLEQVIRETGRLDEGGTLAAWLGSHALKRGYEATIYTFNLNLFDPTWFPAEAARLQVKLRSQLEHKKSAKFRAATDAYLEYFERGGEVRMQDLTRSLIRKFLVHGTPILAGLSSTYLYQSAREWGDHWDADDIRGIPQGHFVVLCGYDRVAKMVRVADPYLKNPHAPSENYYIVPVDRVICAILLGVLTYDANLLMLQPIR